MQGMDHGDMGGMNMHHKKMMMHMTFFWGRRTNVLISGWPGDSLGMYVLCLLVVFAVAVALEWLSNCRFIKTGTNHVAAGLGQTLVHLVRVGLAYLLMLALMSFNAGVFLAVVVGHAVGFLVFQSRVFRCGVPPAVEQGPAHADLPPLKC